MGAIFTLLPIIPLSKIQRVENNCIKNCSTCKKNCPVHIKLGEDFINDGECIACEKCMNVCPKKNLTRQEQKLIKNDIILLIIKAALFFAMGVLLGLCRLF